MSNDFINLYLWNEIFSNVSVFNETFPPQKYIVNKIRKNMKVVFLVRVLIATQIYNFLRTCCHFSNPSAQKLGGQ